MLLISFIRETIRDELEQFSSIDKVDFKEDSMIGTLFYRVLKSQQRNVDTICSMLAHLMNNFITNHQEG